MTVYAGDRVEPEVLARVLAALAPVCAALGGAGLYRLVSDLPPWGMRFEMRRESVRPTGMPVAFVAGQGWPTRVRCLLRGASSQVVWAEPGWSLAGLVVLVAAVLLANGLVTDLGPEVEGGSPVNPRDLGVVWAEMTVLAAIAGLVEPVYAAAGASFVTVPSHARVADFLGRAVVGPTRSFNLRPTGRGFTVYEGAPYVGVHRRPPGSGRSYDAAAVALAAHRAEAGLWRLAPGVEALLVAAAGVLLANGWAEVRP